MKKYLLLLLLFHSITAFCQSDNNTYNLTEVTQPPILLNCNIDATLSKPDQFKKCIFYFINKNIEIITSNKTSRQKAYIEIIIDENGKTQIINSRASSREAEKKVIKVVKKLPKFTPAVLNGIKVKLRYIIPVVFNTYVLN